MATGSCAPPGPGVGSHGLCGSSCTYGSEALETSECPFPNLPEERAGGWGDGITAAKMRDCRWLKPVLVGQFEFVEWTPDKHSRHSRFVRLSKDTEHP
jgi:hypothetical protein